MKRSLRAAAVATAASVTLILSACSSPSTDAGQAGDAGSELTIGAGHVISQLNPAIRTFAMEQVLYPLLWNGLTKQTPDGEVVADLATEWTHNDDLTQWTFTLRDDVTYHDGTPFNAEKVVDAFEYHLNPETGAKEYVKIGLIDTVTAADDSTVVFDLKQPLAVFPLTITEIRMIDIASLDTINQQPNGTGPFTLTDFVPDDHVTLERNDDYFGEEPSLGRINVVKTADATAATTALRSGDIDIMYDLSYADAGGFADSSDIDIVTAEPYHWAQTWKLDTSSPPFDNVLARRALSYAVDREAILERAYHGFGVVATTNNPVSEQAPFFADSGLMDYSYDLEKAKDLFAQAGVHEGDTITWWGPAGIQPEKVTTAEILRDSLSQIGINVEIELKETSEWVAAFIPTGQSYPGLIAPTGAEAPLDPAYIFRFAREGVCECNWSSPQFEADYDAALAVADDAERSEAFFKLQTAVSEEVPVVIPLVTSMLSATRSNVDGVWSNSGGTQIHLESASIEG